MYCCSFHNRASRPIQNETKVLVQIHTSGLALLHLRWTVWALTVRESGCCRTNLDHGRAHLCPKVPDAGRHDGCLSAFQSSDTLALISLSWQAAGSHHLHKGHLDLAFLLPSPASETLSCCWNWSRTSTCSWGMRMWMWWRRPSSPWPSSTRWPCR